MTLTLAESGYILITYAKTLADFINMPPFIIPAVGISRLSASVALSMAAQLSIFHRELEW